MKPIPADDLKLIANEILSVLIRDKDIPKNLVFIDYHGFAKSYLPENLVSNLLKSFGYNAEQLQIEIVRVNSDLTDQIHYHQFSHAFICVLSQENNFPDPESAFAFKNNKWQAISENFQLLIPPNTPHGFTVSHSGQLYFLSVQTPPIVNNSFDDYHLY